MYPFGLPVPITARESHWTVRVRTDKMVKVTGLEPVKSFRLPGRKPGALPAELYLHLFIHPRWFIFIV